MQFIKTRFFHKHLLICFAAIFIVKSSAISQADLVKDERNFQVSISPLLNYQAVKEEKFSSLVYSGNGFGAAASLMFKARNVSHELKALYINGTLAATGFKKETLNQKVINIDYANLYLVNNTAGSSLEFKLGGGLQFQHGERDFLNFINASRSFQTILSLGAVIELDYAFKGNLSGIILKDRITVPFIFSYVKSDYLDDSFPGTAAGESGTSNFFSNNKLATVPQLFRFRNNFEIEKVLNSQHQLALTYAWDYTKIGDTHRVIQAIHEIGVLYRYIF